MQLPAVDRLFVLASEVLTAVGDGWPGDPDDASPLPEQQYVTNGQIAWDGCDVLAVTMARVAAGFEGDPAQEALVSTNAFVAVQFAVFDITLLRCVPDLREEGNEIVLPTPAELTDSAEQIFRDAQAVQNAIVLAQKQGRLATCSGLVIEAWTAQGPQGNMGGGTLRIRLSLL